MLASPEALSTGELRTQIQAYLDGGGQISLNRQGVMVERGGVVETVVWADANGMDFVGGRITDPQGNAYNRVRVQVKDGGLDIQLAMRGDVDIPPANRGKGHTSSLATALTYLSNPDLYSASGFTPADRQAREQFLLDLLTRTEPHWTGGQVVISSALTTG